MRRWRPKLGRMIAGVAFSAVLSFAAPDPNFGQITIPRVSRLPSSKTSLI